jgi:hypothetical protein
MHNVHRVCIYIYIHTNFSGIGYGQPVKLWMFYTTFAEVREKDIIIIIIIIINNNNNNILYILYIYAYYTNI